MDTTTLMRVISVEYCMYTYSKCFWDSLAVGGKKWCIVAAMLSSVVRSTYKVAMVVSA